jgi:hypothetical protein
MLRPECGIGIRSGAAAWWSCRQVLWNPRQPDERETSVKIGSHLRNARDSRSAVSLAKGLVMILRQGRLLESAYGAYCLAIHPPSPLVPADASLPRDRIEGVILSRRSQPQVVSKAELARSFGTLFPIDSLPDDFVARRQSVVATDGWLVVGEYARESARLCFLTPGSCRVVDYYNRIGDVCHIHAIQKAGDDRLYVMTGDTRKVLDLWSVRGEDIEFRERVIARLAGFTASVEVNGDYYFGTDFDLRPNYILRLRDRRKFFFPRLAYRQWSHTFDVVEDRYIVAINVTQDADRSRSRPATVFDTKREAFVYAALIEPQPRSGEACVFAVREAPAGPEAASSAPRPEAGGR